MSVPTAGVTEVPAGTGLRGDDLVTPIEGDVHLPAGTVPPPLVRHHKRPWIGTGEAPGFRHPMVSVPHTRGRLAKTRPRSYGRRLATLLSL